MAESAIVAQYLSNRCACGAFKVPRYHFCLNCYQALPQKKKSALHGKFGKEYEKVYLDACEFLGLTSDAG